MQISYYEKLGQIVNEIDLWFPVKCYIGKMYLLENQNGNRDRLDHMLVVDTFKDLNGNHIAKGIIINLDPKNNDLNDVSFKTLNLPISQLGEFLCELTISDKVKDLINLDFVLDV